MLPSNTGSSNSRFVLAAAALGGTVAVASWWRWWGRPRLCCCPPGSLGQAPTDPCNEAPLTTGQVVDIPPLPPSASTTNTMEKEEAVVLKPLPCYTTGAPLREATRVVVVFTDVYGLDAGRHKVFADQLAEALFLSSEQPTAVVVPDLFRGRPIMRPWMAPTSFLRDVLGSALAVPGMLYRLKYCHPPAKWENDIFRLVVPWIQNQVSNPKHVKFSCVGCCFGGWVVGRVLGYHHPPDEESSSTESSSLQFQRGVGIHPSFQGELLHGSSATAVAERIGKPMLLLPGWNDFDMKPGTRIVNIMTQNWQERMGNNGAKDEEPPVVSIEFPTMLHGWVSRGDPRNPKVAAEQARALRLTVDFLEKHSP